MFNQTVNLNQSPVIILVQPQLGENIGAVARAMLNFNISDLRIVCPRDGWPNQTAIAAASGAGIILENAKIFKSTYEACANLNYIFATTARKRDLTKDIFSPKSSMIKSRAIMKQGQKVGIIFGPERAGLQNEDISLSQAIVSVPINQNFSSLNLAQCVVLLAYEWFNLNQTQESVDQEKESIRYASLSEVEHLRSAFLKNLDTANYFWPENKRLSLIENITNLLGRSP